MLGKKGRFLCAVVASSTCFDAGVRNEYLPWLLRSASGCELIGDELSRRLPATRTMDHRLLPQRYHSHLQKRATVKKTKAGVEAQFLLILFYPKWALFTFDGKLPLGLGFKTTHDNTNPRRHTTPSPLCWSAEIKHTCIYVVFSLV